MNGKGDHRRPEDTEAYRENYDEAFKKEEEWVCECGHVISDKMPGCMKCGRVRPV